MKQWIDIYLQDKATAWAPSTQRSERHRLSAVGHVLDGNPRTLWSTTASTLAPYSRVTTWCRVIDYYEWLMEQGHVKGPNVYRAFRKKHAKRFKNAYTPSLPTTSYQEAQEGIQ